MPCSPPTARTIATPSYTSHHSPHFSSSSLQSALLLLWILVGLTYLACSWWLLPRVYWSPMLAWTCWSDCIDCNMPISAGVDFCLKPHNETILLQVLLHFSSGSTKICILMLIPTLYCPLIIKNLPLVISSQCLGLSLVSSITYSVCFVNGSNIFTR